MTGEGFQRAIAKPLVARKREKTERCQAENAVFAQTGEYR